MNRCRMFIRLVIVCGVLLSASGSRAQSKWEYVNPLNTSNTIRAVAMPSASICYAVAQYGMVLKSTDAGATWFTVKQADRNDDGTNVTDESELFAVSFVNADTGTVVGMIGYNSGPPLSKVWHTTDGGSTWVYQDLPHQYSQSDHADYGPTYTLHGVVFVNALHGTIVGGIRSSDVSNHYVPIIFKTTNGGAGWTTQYQASYDASTYFNAVVLPDSATGTAVGTGGMIVHSLDAGTTWFPQVSHTTRTLNGVHFLSALKGFAVGDSGTILQTVDGGVTWVDHTLPSAVQFNGITFSDSVHGTIVCTAGNILRTADGGKHWTSKNTVNVDLLGVARFGGTMLAAAKYGNILRSVDSGATWNDVTSITPSDLFAISFLDSHTMFAAGKDGTFARTSDNGLSWTQSQLLPGGYIRGMAFRNAQTGFAVGANGDSQACLLQTTDGGKQWSEHIESNCRTLLSVTFADSAVAIAVGTEGTLLRTSNAGNTWTRYDSITDESFYAVEFSSPAVGVALGSAGIMARTSDAGLTWTVIPTNWGTVLDLAFGDSLHGIVVSNSAWYTTDAGLTWTESNFNQSNVWTSAYLTNIRYFAPHRAIAVGIWGVIERTSDDGLTWDYDVTEFRQDLMGMAHFKGQSIYAVGGSGLIVRLGSISPPFVRIVLDTQNVNGPRFSLNAAASHSFDSKDALVLVWRLRSSPAGSRSAVVPRSGQRADIVPDSSGDYIVQLTVYDGYGGCDSTSVTIHYTAPTGVANEYLPTPIRAMLYPLHPNPATSTSTLEFYVPDGEHGTLKVFSATGDEIKMSMCKTYSAGEYSVPFNTSQWPAGLYWCQLSTGWETRREKFLVAH